MGQRARRRPDRRPEQGPAPRHRRHRRVHQQRRLLPGRERSPPRSSALETCRRRSGSAARARFVRTPTAAEPSGAPSLPRGVATAGSSSRGVFHRWSTSGGGRRSIAFGRFREDMHYAFDTESACASSSRRAAAAVDAELAVRVVHRRGEIVGPRTVPGRDQAIRRVVCAGARATRTF